MSSRCLPAIGGGLRRHNNFSCKRFHRDDTRHKEFDWRSVSPTIVSPWRDAEWKRSAVIAGTMHLLPLTTVLVLCVMPMYRELAFSNEPACVSLMPHPLLLERLSPRMAA
jgi:hypothetical protein